MKSIEVNGIYRVVVSFKGWPVQEAQDLAEATGMILGSPYWHIPEDIYKIVDQNDVYSLLAVFNPGTGRPSLMKRYLAVNMHLLECSEPFME